MLLNIIINYGNVLFDLLVTTVIYLKMCFFKDLENFSWERVITEMKECVPDVLDVLAAIAVPNVKVNSEQQSAPLCIAYGILMFTRWKELSLIQKINTIVLSVGHATERVQCIIILCFSASVAFNLSNLDAVLVSSLPSCGAC